MGENEQIELNPTLRKLENLVYSLKQLNDFIYEDIDTYYYDLLEQAIEYGMTPNQFWEEDIELFFCYRNAYIKRLHNQCHIQGLYNFMAYSITIANMFKKNKSDKIDYPKKDLLSTSLEEHVAKIKEQKIILKSNQVNKKNLEEQYRLRLMNCY